MLSCPRGGNGRWTREEVQSVTRTWCSQKLSCDHALVIATSRCLTVVGQPSLQEFKKTSQKRVPEQIKKTAPLPWSVLAGGCPPAVLLWVCSCSTCSLGYCQILRYWPWRTVLMFTEAGWILTILTYDTGCLPIIELKKPRHWAGFQWVLSNVYFWEWGVVF